MFKSRIIVLLCFSLIGYNKLYSQNWHSANDTLKYQTKLGYGEATMGWINKYDTVKCSIKMVGVDEIKQAYKLVYLYNGHVIDNENTVNCFFDDKKRRIPNVAMYSFN